MRNCRTRFEPHTAIPLSFRIQHSALSLCRLPPFPSPNNQLRRRLLLVPCLLPLDLAPGRGGRPAARGLPLAAAQRVVDGIHRHAAHPRIPAQPAALSCLPDREQLLLATAHPPPRGEAPPPHPPHLRGAPPPPPPPP